MLLTKWDFLHSISLTGLPIGTSISHEDVMTYLNRDSATALRDARRLYSGVFDSLPSEVQLIIADMMFNMGYSRLSRSGIFKG